jgi:hypothetical protein
MSFLLIKIHLLTSSSLNDGRGRESFNMEDGLPGAHFMNFLDLNNLMFQKNMDVVNDGIYMCTKNQHELLYILGCIKMTNFHI